MRTGGVFGKVDRCAAVFAVKYFYYLAQFLEFEGCQGVDEVLFAKKIHKSNQASVVLRTAPVSKPLIILNIVNPLEWS
jgi:hypothetical protein